MNSQEILKFCLEKGFLLDKEVLNLFNETSNVEIAKLIIERIKETTNQRIITKSLFNQNKEKVIQIFSNLPKQDQQQLESLKIKLGLSIEISKEISSNPSLISSNYQKGNILIQKKENNKIDRENLQFPGVKILSLPLPSNTKKLEVKDFTTYFRNRVLELKGIIQENPTLKNLVSINKLSLTKQSFSIIGIVSNRTVTKNNNLLLEIEDLTGKIKVLISPSNKELYQKAEEICLDSVLGFSGFGNKEILFVNNLVFPDSRLPERIKSSVEEYVLFIGDIHYGSSLFLESNFLKFIDYLNGKVPNTPEVSKIKYLFLVGDLVAGVGTYPTQEKDLKIKDLEEQFLGLANLLDKIRKDITLIISPGNHDGVRLMEPQPVLNERFAWPLYNLKNVVFTGNPCYVNIGENSSFRGLDILTYHGVSFHYYNNTVPKLITHASLSSPNEIMAYLLQNRHLAPSHSSTQYFPSDQDHLIIKKVPDIFVSGHTHKSAISYYNNILIISVSSWESKTPYQEKMGNHPDFCKVPILNLKTRNIKILDFEEPIQEEIKKQEIQIK